MKPLSVTNYELACRDLADSFCRKHDFEQLGNGSFWATDEPGGVLCTSDFCFVMEDILTDMAYNLPREWIIEYGDFCVENENASSYRAWCNAYKRAKLKDWREL